MIKNVNVFLRINSLEPRFASRKEPISFAFCLPPFLPFLPLFAAACTECCKTICMHSRSERIKSGEMFSTFYLQSARHSKAPEKLQLELLCGVVPERVSNGTRVSRKRRRGYDPALAAKPRLCQEFLISLAPQRPGNASRAQRNSNLFHVDPEHGNSALDAQSAEALRQSESYRQLFRAFKSG